jgi:hypothetical protein
VTYLRHLQFPLHFLAPRELQVLHRQCDLKSFLFKAKLIAYDVNRAIGVGLCESAQARFTMKWSTCVNIFHLATHATDLAFQAGFHIKKQQEFADKATPFIHAD